MGAEHGNGLVGLYQVALNQVMAAASTSITNRPVTSPLLIVRRCSVSRRSRSRHSPGTHEVLVILPWIHRL